MNERPRSLSTRIVAALLAPAILLSSVAPAFAQVEVVVPRAVAPGGGMAVRPVPTALGGLSASPTLSAPSALAAAPAVGAAPSISAEAAPTAAAAAALPALAPAAAVAAVPAASAPADDGSPASGAAPAAAPKTILPASPSQVAQAFGAFLRGFSEVHSPLAAVLGAKLFDGAKAQVPQSAIDSLASEARLDVLPHTSGRMAGGFGLRKASRPAPKPVADEERAQGIPLDADATDVASIEKALRALVDSAPQAFGAPSSQLAKVSVNILPAIQQGQGASIIATFKQAVTGRDDGGSPYQLAVSGKSVTFHIKVFDGKPAIMSMSGGLASGVTADVMTVSYTDDQLTAIAAKRATQPADNAKAKLKSANGKTAPERSGPWKAWLASKKDKTSSKPKTGKKGKTAPKSKPRQGKSKPRNGDDQVASASDEDPAPAAPKFLTRQLTDELDGKWRAINIYQAKDPQGEPVIVIVDVKTGEAFALSAKDFHTGDEAHRHDDATKVNLISGSVQGRATLPTADGGDHGEIGPIALPLTNIYDESGKVVAVTDEKGNFSIPDDGSGQPRKLTVRLAGPLVPFVKDENLKKNGPVEVTVIAKPGEKLTIMLNPVSADPEVAANIVGYVGYLNHHIWMKGLPGMDARMDVPLAGGMVVNGHEEQGNAFYDPSTDSVNLMAAAVITVHDSKGKPVKIQVENTAVWSIEDHEDTHRVVQTYSQIQLTQQQKESPAYRFVKWSMDTIMGADVNESIADVVSYFMRKASTIGEGFYGNLPKGKPDYIRSAEEKTPYDPKNPDPHNGVLAQSMWMTRKGMIERLGEAQGEAYANAMIPLILISQPLNPVDALMHMILWDMREDGSSPFGDLIRRIAHDDHGIDLPAVPAPPAPVA